MDYPTPENSHNGSSMSSIPSLSWQNDDTNQSSNETSHDGQPNELPEEVLQAEREAMENMDQAMADLREDPPVVEAVLPGDENSGEASYTSPTRIHHVTAEMHEANAEYGGTPDGGTPMWDPQTPSNHGQNLNLATRGRFAWAAMALPEELENICCACIGAEKINTTITVAGLKPVQKWLTFSHFLLLFLSHQDQACILKVWNMKNLRLSKKLQQTYIHPHKYSYPLEMFVFGDFFKSLFMTY